MVNGLRNSICMYCCFQEFVKVRGFTILAWFQKIQIIKSTKPSYLFSKSVRNKLNNLSFIDHNWWSFILCTAMVTNFINLTRKSNKKIQTKISIIKNKIINMQVNSILNFLHNKIRIILLSSTEFNRVIHHYFYIKTFKYSNINRSFLFVPCAIWCPDTHDPSNR